MDYVDFQITGIENGWLFAVIESEDRQISISSSYIGGVSAPSLLLSATCELLINDATNSCIRWHSENISYVLDFQTNGDEMYLRVFEIGCSPNSPLSGNQLSLVTPVEPVFETRTSAFMFAISVYNAFKVYSYGEALDEWRTNGFEFQRGEYQMLKRLLRGLQSSNKKAATAAT